MAETFKNSKLALGTSAGDVYTCPASTNAIVILCHVANVDGTSSAEATVSWTDASDSNAETFLLKGGNIPAKAALNILSGKLVLEAGDKIKGLASAAGDLEITLSVLELT